MTQVYKMQSQSPLDFENLTMDFLQEAEGEANLVDFVSHGRDDFQTRLFVFERYYARIDSTASASVLFTQDGSQTTVDLIASGAGNGVFNFSWGSDKNFLKKLTNILSKQGFVLQDQ